MCRNDDPECSLSGDFMELREDELAFIVACFKGLQSVDVGILGNERPSVRDQSLRKNIFARMQLD